MSETDDDKTGDMDAHKAEELTVAVEGAEGDDKGSGAVEGAEGDDKGSGAVEGAEGDDKGAEGDDKGAEVAKVVDAPTPVSSNGIRIVDAENPIKAGEIGYKLVGGKVYAVVDVNNEKEINVGDLKVSATGEDLTTAVIKMLTPQAGGRRRSRRNSRNRDRQSKKRQQKRQSKKRQQGGKKRHGRNSKRNHKK
jgi:hypothetical protein